MPRSQQVFLITVSLWFFSGSMDSQTALNVRLVPSSTSDFGRLVSSPLKAIHNGLAEGGIKQSVVALVNDDSRPIAGYVVKWTTTLGTQSAPMYQIFEEAELIDDPTRPVHGYGLRPHDVRLLALSFNIADSQATDGALIDVINKKVAGQPLPLGSSVVATLDAVVFSDSTFAGPNESRYFERMQAERNGKHDAAVSILLAEKRGESVSQISDRLKESVALGEASDTSSPDSYYRAARGRWAQNFLAILTHGGEPMMVMNAKQTARLKPIRLHKQ